MTKSASAKYARRAVVPVKDFLVKSREMEGRFPLFSALVFKGGRLSYSTMTNHNFCVFEDCWIADSSYSVVRCLFVQIGRIRIENPITLEGIVIRNVRTVGEDDPLGKAWKSMEVGNYSQLPVVSKKGPLD